MLCEELMKRDVSYVSPGEMVQNAAILMRDRNVGFLPVCAAERKVVGTLTDRDIIIRSVADNQNAALTTVREVMTHDVFTCRPEDDVRRAEDLMADHEVARMPVCDADGRLVGVISLSDIVQAMRDGEALETVRRVTAREVSPTQ